MTKETTLTAAPETKQDAPVAEMSRADKFYADTGADKVAEKKPEPIVEVPVENKTPDVKEPEAQNKEAPKDAPAAEKTETDKPGDASAVFELKLPEGSTLPPEHLKAVEEFAKFANLNPEQAQRILERDSMLEAAQDQAEKRILEEKSNEWRTQALADKEIGGDNHKEAVYFAHVALKKYASPALMQELDATGLGNHPELIRSWYRVGKAMASDSFVRAGAAPVERKPMAEILYDNTKEGN